MLNEEALWVMNLAKRLMRVVMLVSTVAKSSLNGVLAGVLPMHVNFKLANVGQY